MSIPLSPKAAVNTLALRFAKCELYCRGASRLICLAGREDAAEVGGGLCKPVGPSIDESATFMIMTGSARVALLALCLSRIELRMRESA